MLKIVRCAVGNGLETRRCANHNIHSIERLIPKRGLYLALHFLSQNFWRFSVNSSF